MDNSYDPNRGTSQSYIPSYGAQQPQAIFTEEKPHRGKLVPSAFDGTVVFNYSESINKIMLHSEEFGSVRGTI